MNVLGLVLGTSLLAVAAASPPPRESETDTIKTSRGDLKITFLGHGTLMFLN